MEYLEKIIIEAKEYGCTGFKLYNDISYDMLKKIVPLCHNHGVNLEVFRKIPGDGNECGECRG